jgi:hypothetical protein
VLYFLYFAVFLLFPEKFNLRETLLLNSLDCLKYIHSYQFEALNYLRTNSAHGQTQ